MKLIKKTVITRLGDDKEVPYLIRWTLFTCPWFSIKIHKILISDDDCLHDHPWAFISFILKGGYVEESYKFKNIGPDNMSEWGRSQTIKKLYGPGSVLYRPAQYAHRLDVYQPAWTLVFTSGKEREWGFWSKKGWIPWFDYTKQNRC